MPLQTIAIIHQFGSGASGVASAELSLPVAASCAGVSLALIRIGVVRARRISRCCKQGGGEGDGDSFHGASLLNFTIKPLGPEQAQLPYPGLGDTLPLGHCCHADA